MRTLGILGGMGPLATADFYRKLIQLTPASQDADHVPVILYAVPQIPDRVSALENRGPSPEPALRDAACRLVIAGAQGIAIPCNTAHVWFDAVGQASAVDGIHIVDAVVSELNALHPHCRRVGLLATSATLNAALYPVRAERMKYDVEWMSPNQDDQQSVLKAIAAVKAGRLDIACPLLVEVADRMVAQGAQAIVAACTEVPIVLGPADCKVPLIDSTQALALACVKWACLQD